jgi:hypothetical protein
MWKYGIVRMVSFVATLNLEIQPLPIFSKHFVYSRIIHQKKNVPM